MSLEAVELGIVGACTGYIKPIDNGTCLFRNSNFTEAVEMRQRSVNIGVSQTEHSMMQMKTTDDMRNVHI